MHGEHGFNFVEHLPVIGHWPNHVVMSILISVVLVLLTWVARVQLGRVRKTPGGGLVPDSKLTFRNFFELVAESLYNMTESVLGRHDAEKYFPVIGSLFVFIFVSNLAGLIPGFLPPTDNLNVTLALGIVVFFYFMALGFKEHGIAYLKHFVGPVWWLFFLMIPIEIISTLIRPVSLAFRLRGNISGDHMVLALFSNMTPVLVPVIFYGLGLFVSFVQAFVFCLLTMVYVQLATAHDH
jgi:F-type H+-transporting ATPase subunit a